MITELHRKRSRQLFIVGDDLCFGKTVSHILTTPTSTHWSIRYSTYSDFPAVLNAQFLQVTDLILLDLWRTYPTGLRAEGVAVAEKLIQLGLKTLIVSPLALDVSHGTLGYWDMGSQTSLLACCQQLLLHHSNNPPPLSPEVKQIVEPFLALPEVHHSRVAISDHRR